MLARSFSSHPPIDKGREWWPKYLQNAGMERRPLKCCTAKQLDHNPTVAHCEVKLDLGPKSITISILEGLSGAIAESQCSRGSLLLRVCSRSGHCRAAEKPGQCLGSAGQQP